VFVDWAKVLLKAGDGGNGCVSFRREKYVQKGGPDGGDGGHGASIYFTASVNLKTLYDFRLKSRIAAPSGGDGKGKNQTGESPDDIEIRVPVGTLVYRDGDLIADLTVKDEKMLAVKGGKGGRGNIHFKSSTRQTPRIAEKGVPGEKAEIVLELKLIADVGIVGFPNAGKTSFLRKISSVSARVGNYPFTTLQPNLGVAKIWGKEIVFADMPGIIEKAHEGKGLGLRFLRHTERTKVLLFLIDIFGYDRKTCHETFVTLRKEMELYKPGLLEKPSVMALNKADLPGSEDKIEEFRNSFPGKFHVVSALTGDGIDGLMKNIYGLV